MQLQWRYCRYQDKLKSQISHQKAKQNQAAEIAEQAAEQAAEAAEVAGATNEAIARRADREGQGAESALFDVADDLSDQNIQQLAIDYSQHQERMVMFTAPGGVEEIDKRCALTLALCVPLRPLTARSVQEPEAGARQGASVETAFAQRAGMVASAPGSRAA